MSIMIKKVTAVLSMVGFLFILGGVAQAQEAKAKEKLITPSLIEQLEKEAVKFKGQMDEINKIVSQDISKIRNAGSIFDKMIERIQTAAKTYGPESSYISNIDKLIEQANTEADNARTDGYKEFADAFEQDVKDLKVFKDKALSIYKDSERNIALLKERKKYFVYVLKRKYFDRAKATLKEGEKLMDTYRNSIKKTVSSVPDKNDPAKQSQ